MIHCLFDAVRQGKLDLVKQAISCCNIINNDWSDYKLLAIASKNKDKQMMELLLNNGCRLQKESEEKLANSPLFYAITSHNIEILRLLLSKNISFSKIDHSNESLFELLLEQTCENEILSLILEAYEKENFNPTDIKGFTLLHISCYLGNLNLIKKYLNTGSDVNACVTPELSTYGGYSPLHFTVESGSPKAVEIVLQYGADITIKNSNGKSAFYLSCFRKNNPIIYLLMLAHCKKNVNYADDEGFSILHAQLFYKHMTTFNISYPVEFNADWSSWSPLHYAVISRNIEAVEYLVKNQANVNVKDSFGITPLHLACQYSNEEVKKIIGGALDNPLLYQNDQIQIVELLLLHNGDINVQDKFGKTPMHHALENFIKMVPVLVDSRIRPTLVEKRLALINLLLKYGANVNISDDEGVTVLHDLTEWDSVFDEDVKVELSKVFLSKGANIDAETHSKKTPLFSSIRNRFLKLAEVFVSAGADLNCQCKLYNNFTPLHAVTIYAGYNSCSIKLVNILLENGADVHAKEVDGATALHIAIDCHGLEKYITDFKDEMALSLLNYGAKVDAKDMKGQTPLHRACLNKYALGTKVLLDNGADINLEDEFTCTPLTLACYKIQFDNNNISFFSIVRHHIHKLKFIKFYVSEKNILHLLELEKLYSREFKVPKIDDFLILCSKETEKMKNTKIDKYTSLYNILFKSSNEMVTHCKNDAFEKIITSKNFELEFELYGFMLVLQFKKGILRRKLLEPLEESFQKISKCAIPCIDNILQYLSDSEVKKLSEALNV